MSLPPGFLDELRNRLSLSQVVGRKVSWDRHKSNPAKGDMWAPCPFHQEKTASFHVDDRKGFYYCFGCHAKGDAISFVRETENAGFMEAVEILAGEAGMSMPARDPEQAARADRRTQLIAVMEQAVQVYRLCLNTGAGAAARDYLAGRGLDADACARWDIGYAPGGWQALWDALRDKGVAEDLILEAGLAKPSRKGGSPYDTFRDRIMIPIRDAQGRPIAFGGRAMDPGEDAKYLNSPETPLFDKGRVLFNHAQARAAAGSAPLIVVEGYMDVIALAESGFPATVAPLGTAVTETQLRLLWRMSDEPVIALDGDGPGLKAALKVIDLALPLIEAGQALRFARMPADQDPDDVVRGAGPQALRDLIDAADPMVRLLWERETQGRVLDSPERRAALDKDLRAVVAQIKDPTIRRHYGDEFARLRRDLLQPPGARAPAGQGARRPWRGGGDFIPPAQASTRNSLLATARDGAGALREALVLSALIDHPDLIEQFESDLLSLPFAPGPHRALQDALLALGHTVPGDLRAHLAETIGAGALEKLQATGHVRIAATVAQGKERAKQTVREAFDRLRADRGLEREIAEAEEVITGLADEGVTWRLGQAAEARNRAGKTDDDGGGGDFDLAQNGARVDRAERAALDAIVKRLEKKEPGPT